MEEERYERAPRERGDRGDRGERRDRGERGERSERPRRERAEQQPAPEAVTDDGVAQQQQQQQEPSLMRAIEITRFGKPEVLVETVRPDPVPAAGEVLVRVRASGVNRPDVLQRKGAYAPRRAPPTCRAGGGG
jgi:hypothetical protein